MRFFSYFALEFTLGSLLLVNCSIHGPKNDVQKNRQPTSAHLDCSTLFLQIKDAAKRDRAMQLAQDPAHDGSITPNSFREAQIGLDLEEAKLLSGPIMRDPSGQSEFLDAKNQRWDVKAFHSFDNFGKPISVQNIILKISEAFQNGENLILDTRKLSTTNVQSIVEFLKNTSQQSRVLWYPIQ